MKQKLLLVYLIGLISCSLAKAETQKLVLWLRNHTQVEYNLCDKPVVSFDQEGSLLITTTTMMIYWPHDQVLRFTYTGDESGIEAVKEHTHLMRVEEDNHTIILTGLVADTEISVYTPDGILCKRLTTDREGTLVVDLSLEPSGLYILKIDDTTYKILKP